jgi:hypothetical protein
MEVRMPGLRQARRFSALLALVVGAVLALTAQIMAAPAPARTGAGAPARAAGAPAHATAAGPAVKPRKTGEIDCNGLSPLQKPVRETIACADPRGSWGGRFYENGRYIGHDEPSATHISNRRGSGGDTTFTERPPVEPKGLPTVSKPGHDTTHFFELSVAPWFSNDVCDPNSAPLTPCTPESDANAPSGNYPGAGAAFVELQFYPPGFGPFVDATSCDDTHWCSALTIDSLECTGNGSGPCNPNCTEPVNFGFIQANGVPTGPPSPQLSDLATEPPNSRTLLFKPGDVIRVHMFDAKVPGGHALEARETDLSTGQSGYMIAWVANRFMNTNPFDCTGTPFNFQPEYSSTRAQNIIPWGIGPYMINNEYEIGHFEPCTSVSDAATFISGSFTDTYYKTCAGPYESAADTSATCEPDDSPCYPFGDTHGGASAPDLVTGCGVFFDAIGDLDYDGTPYYPDWPDSVTPDKFPSTFLQLQPTTVGGHRYPQIQFVTDSSATQFNTNCNLTSGMGCVLPPKGPGNFYPYFTQALAGGHCVWEFGNMQNGNTFGKDAQYGSVGPGTIGAFAGPIRYDRT